MSFSMHKMRTAEIAEHAQPDDAVLRALSVLRGALEYRC
jgi:hypothetical protein